MGWIQPAKMGCLAHGTSLWLSGSQPFLETRHPSWDLWHPSVTFVTSSFKKQLAYITFIPYIALLTPWQRGQAVGVGDRPNLTYLLTLPCTLQRIWWCHWVPWHQAENHCSGWTTYLQIWSMGLLTAAPRATVFVWPAPRWLALPCVLFLPQSFHVTLANCPVPQLSHRL